MHRPLVLISPEKGRKRYHGRCSGNDKLRCSLRCNGNSLRFSDNDLNYSNSNLRCNGNSLRFSDSNSSWNLKNRGSEVKRSKWSRSRGNNRLPEPIYRTASSEDAISITKRYETRLYARAMASSSSSMTALKRGILYSFFVRGSAFFTAASAARAMVFSSSCFPSISCSTSLERHGTGAAPLNHTLRF